MTDSEKKKWREETVGLLAMINNGLDDIGPMCLEAGYTQASVAIAKAMSVIDLAHTLLGGGLPGTSIGLDVVAFKEELEKESPGLLNRVMARVKESTDGS